MAEIIPAIIPKSLEEIKEKVSLIKGHISSVQIDICDGVFVKSKSWPFIDVNDEEWVKIKNQQNGLPFWEDIEYEMDLMVKDPNYFIDDCISAGAHRIVLHLEALSDPEHIIEYFRNRFSKEEKYLSDPEIGIAIGNETSIFEIEKYINKVDFIQLMGIREIGAQGQPFNDGVLDRVSELREKYPDLLISVDGGVNIETAERILASGANRLVVGSAIWNSENILETIDIFKKL